MIALFIRDIRNDNSDVMIVASTVLLVRNLGTSLDKYFSRIGYSGSHEQSIEAVLNKEVDAAFVASSSRGLLIKAKKVRHADILVLWKSEQIPFAPFVYRGQLCEEIKKKIRTVFFNKNLWPPSFLQD